MSDSPISPVVPSSIERPKRIAKQLHRLYPLQKLSTCQAVTAHLFGHADWFALDNAVKHSFPSSPDDRALDEAALVQRRLAQVAIVCNELGGTDFEAEHAAPRWEPREASANLADLMPPPGHRELRVEMALRRWQIVFAVAVIAELLPTADSAHVVRQQEYADLLAEHPKEFVSTLPFRLGRWWRVNMPNQPEVGIELSMFALDVDRQTSILLFAQYWGTLCMHYAHSIDWAMGMGTALLLAQRYADLHLNTDDELWAALGSAHRSDSEKKAIVERAIDAQDAQIDLFFSGYPRDDFRDVYRAQPQAFSRNAAAVVKILDKPRSKRGTWSTHR